MPKHFLNNSETKTHRNLSLPQMKVSHIKNKHRIKFTQQFQSLSQDQGKECLGGCAESPWITLLPRALSTLILLSFQPLSPSCSTVQSWEQSGWLEGEWDVPEPKRKRDLESGEKKEPICIPNQGKVTAGKELFTWAANAANPPLFDFSCNLDWRSCQNCSAHSCEPHLCPILLPASTAPHTTAGPLLVLPLGNSSSSLLRCRFMHAQGSVLPQQRAPRCPLCSLSPCSQLVMVQGKLEVFSESKFQPAALETFSVS